MFDEFCNTLYSRLQALCKASKTQKSHSTMRARLWTAFHKVAVHDLPPIWDNLFCSLGLVYKDKMICQSANQKLFEMLLTKHFNEHIPQGTATAKRSAVDDVFITKNELNILQYVGGFVPHALLQKFERNSRRYEQCIECLREMAVAGDSSDFLQYTREWISKVNRGGLFPLNDQTFLQFTEIEKSTRTFLASHIVNRKSTLEDIIKKIEGNKDVQFHWTLILQSIHTKEEADWLLQEIVKLYMSIRGFSMAAMWMELYKNKHKKCTSKSVQLRKGLA